MSNIVQLVLGCAVWGITCALLNLPIGVSFLGGLIIGMIFSPYWERGE